MNERVARLRQRSLEAEPALSLERAALITEYYRDCRTASVPILRAQALRHLMENKNIYIGSDELIVGERGPAPKAAPTYPELCCHSMEDLEILDSRPKISYHVDAEAKTIQREQIIPYWQGRSIRDLIFREMSQEWKDAYEAGIFTEFMEQRAPGHTALGDVIYGKGLLDLKSEVETSLSRLDFLNDPEAFLKQEELRAMWTAAGAIIHFAERHAEKAEEMAANESNPQRQAELRKIADVCRRVPAHAPRDFWEALQAYWFTHLGVISELNTWDSFCQGGWTSIFTPFTSRVSPTERSLVTGPKNCSNAFG